MSRHSRFGRVLRGLLIFALGIGSAWPLAACGPEGVVGGHTQDDREREVTLNKQDFDAAVRHLAALPYLPWRYTSDGCYARAFYFSLTLAALEIPSRHVYCVADSAHPIMGSWRYHVAPVVSKDSVPDELYVLDPLFDKQEAIPLSEWVGRQDPAFRDVGYVHYPDLRVKPGTSYGSWYGGEQVLRPDHPDAQRLGEPDFADMPAFSMYRVNRACARMHRYIDKETTTSVSTKCYKHRRLSQMTERMVGKLDDMGKLTRSGSSGDGAELSPSCRDYPGTVPPPGCPADDGVTNPTTRTCCLASLHFCWSNTLGRCMAPGDQVGSYVCSDGGNWAEAGALPPPPEPEPDPEPGDASWSCARSAYHGQQLWTCGEDEDLHRCVSGAPVEQDCPSGCLGAAVGKRDHCIEPASGWSCGSSAAFGDQVWTCSAGVLYKCDPTGRALKVRCESGCDSNAYGTNDTCR